MLLGREGVWLLAGMSLSLMAALGISTYFHQAPWALAAAGALVVATSLALTFFMHRRYAGVLNALHHGLRHFQDGEFAIKLSTQGTTQQQQLLTLFNQVAAQLGASRSRLLQREFLLDTIFDTVTSALLLVDQRGKILLGNPAARQLLANGKAIKGSTLEACCETLAPTLADALQQSQDQILNLEGPQGEPEVWHFSCQHFRLTGIEHRLFHLKPMTRAISQAEVAAWKNMLRVFSHELNNSLGPIASLANSGSELLNRSASANNLQLLTEIFKTIKERAYHLNDFLSAYAQFARLPRPHLAPIHWPELIQTLQNLLDFQCQLPLPTRPGFGDTAQLTQVLINLVRNAQEAGATAAGIHLHITPQADWDLITLSDNGSGMDNTQMEQALLPFYSTKRNGTGLGLALCREIVDAHGGQIKLSHQQPNGCKVTLWLPTQPQHSTHHQKQQEKPHE